MSHCSRKALSFWKRGQNKEKLKKSKHYCSKYRYMRKNELWWKRTIFLPHNHATQCPVDGLVILVDGPSPKITPMIITRCVNFCSFSVIKPHTHTHTHSHLFCSALLFSSTCNRLLVRISLRRCLCAFSLPPSLSSWRHIFHMHESYLIHLSYDFR